MAISLSVVEQPAESRWQWPDSSPLTPRERAAIEAMHTAPQHQRRDELAELRSANTLLEQRVAALERQLAAQERRHKRLRLHVFGGTVGEGRSAGFQIPEGAPASDKIGGLIETVHALQAVIFGENLPRTEAEIRGFEFNIERMIRATARTKEHGERIAALETRPVYKFVGTFTEGSEYSPGNICVRGGGCWICTERTRDVPGKSPCWAQMSRPGRDGRDARSVVEEQRRQRARPEAQE